MRRFLDLFVFTLKLVFGLVILVCGLPSQGQPSASGPQRQVVTKTLRPLGANAGTAVVITYEAVVYDPAEIIPTAGTVEWDTRTPETAFRGVFLANKQGDTNLIVRGFVPAERERIAGMVAKAEMLEKNTAAYGRVAKVSLLQKTFYGEHVILTTAQEDTRGHQWPMSYAFKRTNEGWLLTNELSDDPVYSQLMEIIAPKAPPKPK